MKREKIYNNRSRTFILESLSSPLIFAFNIVVRSPLRAYKATTYYSLLLKSNCPAGFTPYMYTPHHLKGIDLTIPGLAQGLSLEFSL